MDSVYRAVRESRALHLAAVTLIALVIYSNTFDVPFQWDEKHLISGNPAVREIGYFLHPSKAEGMKEYTALKHRYVGYLTFALNYKMHGTWVRGYHAVNIAIHIINGILIYLITSAFFKTPLFSGSIPDYSGAGPPLALAAAGLFVSHPVQTEAVTYIFQRLASLCALFYLLCFLLYFKSRLSGIGLKSTVFYALALLSAVLAMKTKENAFTLPLALALAEFFFFEGFTRKTAFRLAPFLLTLLIIPLSYSSGGFVPAVLLEGGRGVSSMQYLFTQFRAVITYMRLLVFPLGQNIDYDYPVLVSFSDPKIIFSLLFHVSAIGLSLYLYNKSKGGRPPLRLAAFGILWFYLALSLESGVIPLQMLIVEYRVYLPSAGFFWAVTAGLAYPFISSEKKKVFYASVLSIAAIVAVLSYLTYERNKTWHTEVSLWEDVVMKSPDKARGHYNLGLAYLGEERFAEAAGEFEAAIGLEPGDARAHNNLAIAYGRLGRTRDSIYEFKKAIASAPGYLDARVNLGVAYLDLDMAPEARKEFEAVIALEPGHRAARAFLSYIDGLE